MLVDDVEFVSAMRRLGFRGSLYVLKEVFASLDANRSGAIEFDELVRAVRSDSRRHAHLSCLPVTRARGACLSPV